LLGGITLQQIVAKIRADGQEPQAENSGEKNHHFMCIKNVNKNEQERAQILFAVR